MFVINEMQNRVRSVSEVEWLLTLERSSETTLNDFRFLFSIFYFKLKLFGVGFTYVGVSATIRLPLELHF